MEKKKIVQISVWVIVIWALALNFGWFVWGDDHKKWNRVSPLDVTSYEQIDEKFLGVLERDSWMTLEEIKTEMDNNPWKKLSVILEEKGIVLKAPGWRR